MRDFFFRSFISSDNAEFARGINDILSKPDSQAILDNELDVNISFLNVVDDITANVVVTIDSSGAEDNLQRAADLLQNTFQDQGYTASAESNRK